MCKYKSKYVLIIILFCFSFLAGCESSDEYKKEIFNLVEKQNFVFLEDIVENDFTDTMSFDRLKSVDVLEHCVNFYCGGYGLSVSSHEYGFYYSFDDQPLGVWENTEFCTRDDLSKDGNGFSGDYYHNSYYTEKICDHFWYYELHF